MPLSQSILTRLQHQHEALPGLIENLTEQQLRQRIDPGKWSAFEHIAHLAAYQPAFLSRLERIRTEDTPSFERYVADNDPLFSAYLTLPLNDLLHLITLRAGQIFNSLTVDINDSDAVYTDALPPADRLPAGLLRTGLHPRYGKLSITQWTQFYLLHEAHHLFAIFMLTQDLRAAFA